MPRQSGIHCTAATSFVLLLLLIAVVPSTWAQSTPVAFSQPAAPVRATYATLNGMAWIKGYASIAWFEWGVDAQYGNTTDPVSIGNGTTVIRVTAPLSALTEGGIYHFRLVISNSVGIARGFDQRFTTGTRIQNWGSYTYGFPSVPGGLTNLVGVGAGHGHCLAIRNNGTVAAWGVGWAYPNYGQTVVPTGLSNVMAVAGGYSHSLALREDGTVVGWGKYMDATPATIPAGLSNVIAIAGGDNHSVALKADGTVVAWGNNAAQSYVPFGLRNIVAISCGSAHTLALGANSIVSVWGGDNGTVAPLGSNLVAIASEVWYNLDLSANGTVAGAGPVYSDVPMPKNLTNVVAIATGYGYGEVLKADGTLAAWGRADDATNIPPLLSNVVAFASGDFHCIGLAPVNLPPSAIPISAYGTTNHDLTISLFGYDPNGDELASLITTLPSNGRLFQSTALGRGQEITAPGTFLSDPKHVIFVPEPGGYGVAYATFNYAFNDGQYQSSPALCTISIMPPTQVQSARVLTGATNAFSLSFTGLPGGTYSVLFSEPLGYWINLGYALEGAPGQFSFLDYSITNKSGGFYRVRSP